MKLPEKTVKPLPLTNLDWKKLVEKRDGRTGRRRLPRE
jgi:hypothetical protein